MNIETWKELKIFENKILQSNDEVKELTVYYYYILYIQKMKNWHTQIQNVNLHIQEINEMETT